MYVFSNGRFCSPADPIPLDPSTSWDNYYNYWNGRNIFQYGNTFLRWQLCLYDLHEFAYVFLIRSYALCSGVLFLRPLRVSLIHFPYYLER